MKTKNKQSVVILGAGLAGLATGYELAKAGFMVTIIEKESQVGGLARTIEKNGFRFDTGPHRWYTKNDMVNTWMLRLLDKEVIKVPRLTRIYFDKKFFHYPIKIKSTLAGMGLFKTLQAVIDYFIVRFIRLFDKREPITLEDGYVTKFGRTLYKMFFKRYSEKLWGTSCVNISADWIGQRTRGFNISTIIKSIFMDRNKVVSFVDEFSYPERGIGRIAEKLAEEIIKQGGKIITNADVIKIITKKDKIAEVLYKKNNKEYGLKGDHIVSSIALSDFVSSLTISLPKQIRLFNERLTYRDELQVAVFINKTGITPDTWIYVHALDLPYIRLMEMDNWSKKLSPKGTTTLVFEIACKEGDEMWTKTDKEISDLVINTFIDEFKLLDKSNVLGYHIHRMPKEYPVYHIGYKNDVAQIKTFLNNFSNLQLVGRNGTFRYNNMDHSIEMGLYAAWNIIEGERKFDIESVNIEREYLEEKKTVDENVEFSEDRQVEKVSV